MRLLLIATALVLAAPAPSAAAQDMQSDSSCTYEQCALRANGSVIVRGREPVVVSKRVLPLPGLLDYDPELTKVVATAPTAVNHAVQYERLQAPIAISYYGGLALLAIAALPEVHDGIRIGSAAGGVVLVGRGLYLAHRADRTFSQALQEHNASLHEE